MRAQTGPLLSSASCPYYTFACNVCILYHTIPFQLLLSPSLCPYLHFLLALCVYYIIILPESCPYYINPCRTFLLHHAHTISSSPFPCNMIFQYHTFDFHTITVPCIMHILCLIHLFHVSQGTRQAHTMPCTMIFLSPAPCLIDISNFLYYAYHTQNTKP